MNRNSIRTKVKITTCCLAGAVVISGSSFVSNAAVTAGAANFAAITESEVQNSNLTAGVSFNLAKYLDDNPVEEVEADENETDDSVTEDGTEEEAKAETEVQEEKSEFSDIGISNVDDYVNIRGTASTDGEVVGKLYSNSAVTILGAEGEWYQIHSGNCEGYIKSEYIITGDEELAKSVSSRVAIVNTDNLNIRNEMSKEGGIIGQVSTGEQLLVVEETDGWVKVSTDEGEGYVSADFVKCANHYKVAESKEEEEARLKKEEEERRAAEEARRQAEERAASDSNSGSGGSSSGSSSGGGSGSSSGGDSGKSYNPPSGGSGQAVVDYACQFVGNPYVYGGTSLTNGADCSGFIMSVYAAFGVGLPHSSSGMRSVGYEVSTSDMQPGDIICYDGHVAIYVGGDTIVHASTEATGIKYTSPAAYRSIITVRRIF